jgi:H+-transporting ATPase
VLPLIPALSIERPSVALFLAFCLAQLISSIIAAYGDWGFSDVQGVSYVV